MFNLVKSDIAFAQSPALWYRLLEQAFACSPNYDEVYRNYNTLFTNLLEQNTATTTIRFNGNYAKSDFLLKQHNAPLSLIKRVNSFRTRSEEQRPKCCADDLKTLALFVNLLYPEAQIPPALVAHFPTRRVVRASAVALKSPARMTVTEMGEREVLGTIDGIKYRLSLGSFYADAPARDWLYLKKIVESGSQLSLVHPEVREGVVFAEYIVYEPDILINVTTVANCFEPYGATFWNALINRFRPSADSPATMLGHFAGQMLDEELRNSSKDYAQIALEFMQKNALTLSEVELTSGFHVQAQEQRENIREAISELEQSVHHAFDREKVVLEPTFISSALGLVGRMDLYQLDTGLVVEQKSGKGAWPEPIDGSARAAEKHNVQILLYMMLLRYGINATYRQNEQRFHAFLLYSKYRKSLTSIPPSLPDVMHEAMRVRNGIAWMEKFLSTGGIEVLSAFTPEKFLLNKCAPRLWSDYSRPQIESVLDPIQNASPLERAYFNRFVTFVATEHLLSKIGTPSRASSGFASAWLSSLDEKISDGKIFLGLTINSFSAPTNIEHIVLNFNHSAGSEQNKISDFRRGDSVLLYPYQKDEQPQVSRNMLFRCSIKEITESTITLSLRDVQPDSRAFDHYADSLWTVEHDFVEASYTNIYKGLHAFLTAPKERRDLILMQRAPRFNTENQLNFEHHRFPELALRVKQADDFFIIIGPPGTGKTSFGMLHTLREALCTQGASVVVTAYTNRAVDEICEKLTEEKIDFIRMGNRHAAAPAYVDSFFESKAARCTNLNEVKQLLCSTNVVVATTTWLNSHPEFFKQRSFDLAIIDEASQILEPDLLGLLSATTDDKNSKPAIRKFVMIGDQKQLPAVVQQSTRESAVVDPALNAIGLLDCRNSLFERLLSKYEDDARVVYLLTQQGRMHEQISAFPSRYFYHDKLRIAGLPHQTEPQPSAQESSGVQSFIHSHRTAFVNAPIPDDALTSTDNANSTEAQIIVDLLGAIYHTNESIFDPAQTVGVIVPYRSQISTIYNAIEHLNIEQLNDITIDTVERFQGSQRDYIIYGFTIKKYHQLNFLASSTFVDSQGAIIDRRLNVAITRARKHLFLVGNEPLLRNNDLYFSLIEDLKLTNHYVEAGSFIPPTVEQHAEQELAIKQQLRYGRAEINDDATALLFASTYHDQLLQLNARAYAQANLTFDAEITFVDFAAGTSAAAIAFDSRNKIARYIAIDSREPLRRLGIEMFKKQNASAAIDSCAELAELPLNDNILVLNLSSYFALNTPTEAENVARSLLRQLKQRSRRAYIFVNQPTPDFALESFRAFYQTITIQFEPREVDQTSLLFWRSPSA